MTVERDGVPGPSRLNYLRARGTAAGSAAIAFVFLVGVALLERVRTRSRRLRGERPRLLWGPTAIHSIKYSSEAMRQRGYESRTYVIALSTVSKRSDFDACRDDFRLPRKLEAFRDYYIFFWALRHADVFIGNFNLGIMRFLPLQYLEYPLMRLAGKKLIVVPFGGDIAVQGQLGDIEEPLFEDYPELPGFADLFTRYVDYTTRWANVVIRMFQPGYVPRYNVIWPSHITFDVDSWTAGGVAATGDGDGTEVTVLHAPNHRRIKGTSYLEQAVEQLRREGLPVRLVILEGVPNDQVRQAIFACDIVADQLLIGYALFAIEGMAAGKPVLTNLSRVPEEVRDSEQIQSCPVVDTDPEHVTDDLRRLVTDPEVRARLGEEGRRFVERFHSLDGSGEVWEAIIEHAWSGRDLPAGLPAKLASSKRRESPR